MQKECPRCKRIKDASEFRYYSPGTFYVVDGKYCNQCIECPECKKIRKMSDFHDARLRWGFGRFCNYCKGKGIVS